MTEKTIQAVSIFPFWMRHYDDTTVTLRDHNSETGSLNKAAEILYVARPSLTSSIKELERELGISIFHRSGRGVTHTNDGVEFVRMYPDTYLSFLLMAMIDIRDNGWPKDKSIIFWFEFKTMLYVLDREERRKIRAKYNAEKRSNLYKNIDFSRNWRFNKKSQK